MKYSGDTRPAVVRTAILHAQQILAEKNHQPKKSTPKPKKPVPRDETYWDGVRKVVLAFFHGK
jgi:hypothetical protein